jgi:hypothetical protein
MSKHVEDGLTGLHILCLGILIVLVIEALGLKHEIVNAKQEIIQAIHGEASR